MCRVSDAQQRENERAGHAGDREREVAARRGRCRAGDCCAHAPMSREPFKIASLPRLWYANEDGERWIPPEDYSGAHPPPPGFVYQHSRFPTTLTDGVLRLTQATEVEACPHPSESVSPTGGWIEGIEGRRCSACQGTQTRNADEPWAAEWDSGGSQRVLQGNSGWSQDLAVELVKHGASLGDAILFAAVACERCSNVAAWKIGLDWGYESDSDDAASAGTSCELCTPASVIELGV